MLNLSKEAAIIGKAYPPIQRNICVVLGCIAEKLAGPTNMEILNEGTIDYLLTNLVSEDIRRFSFPKVCNLMDDLKSLSKIQSMCG